MIIIFFFCVYARNVHVQYADLYYDNTFSSNVDMISQTQLCSAAWRLADVLYYMDEREMVRTSHMSICQ